MAEMVVVFTHDVDGYYVEEILDNFNAAKRLWNVEKVIYGSDATHRREMQQELNKPTVKVGNQFAFRKEKF